MIEIINKLRRRQSSLLQELQREATTEELAAAMESTPERILEIQKLSIEAMSLETPIGEHEDSFLGDLIEDRTSVTPYQYYNDGSQEKDLEDFFMATCPRA